MSVRLNEAALRGFLESPYGPIGQDLQQRAERVTEQAAFNASGEVIGIETGALDSGIHFQVGHDADGLFATVSTPANKDGFYYPAYWDQNGRPWLTSALRDAFDGGN